MHLEDSDKFRWRNFCGNLPAVIVSIWLLKHICARTVLREFETNKVCFIQWFYHTTLKTTFVAQTKIFTTPYFNQLVNFKFKCTKYPQLIPTLPNAHIRAKKAW